MSNQHPDSVQNPPEGAHFPLKNPNSRRATASIKVKPQQLMYDWMFWGIGSCTGKQELPESAHVPLEDLQQEAANGVGGCVAASGCSGATGCANRAFIV